MVSATSIIVCRFGSDGRRRYMNRNMQRFGACSAFISMGLFFAGLISAGFLPALAPTLTPSQLAEVYRSNQTGILFGGLLIVVASGFCGPFIAAIFLQLRRMEGARPLGAYAQLASGIANIQFFIFPGLLFVVVAYRPDRPVDSLSALNDLAWIVTLLPWTVGAMQCLCIGWSILANGNATTPYPRWLGYFNIWIAIGMGSSSVVPFFKFGPFAWNGAVGFWIPAAVFGLWELIMGIMTLHAVNHDTLDEQVPSNFGGDRTSLAA
jgi:hypothetical protein